MKEIKLSADGLYSFCETCAPQTGYKKKFYKNISPEMQDYYKNNGMAYDMIPAHNPDCEKIFRGSGPDITSPVNGNEYYINLQDPEPLQLTAHAGTDVSRLYWYINDEFYKTTAAGEKQFFIPIEGPVKISCTDDKGRNRNIRIMVKYVKL